MKALPTPEEVKSMDLKQITRLLREFEDAYQTAEELEIKCQALDKRNADLLFKKENLPEEFEKEKEKAHFFELKTWRDRIRHIIRKEDRFMTSLEIFEIIYKVYCPECLSFWTFPYGNICQHLYLAVGYRQIKREIILGQKAHYFGLPSFYDSEGQLKEKYFNQLNNY